MPSQFHDRWLWLRDAVSGPGDGLDYVWLPELSPQPSHGDLHGLREWVGVLVPDLFQEVFCAERRRRASHEPLKPGELFGRQFALASVSGYLPAEGVELDARRAQDAGMRGGLAPGQAADPEDELWEVERLGQVVIGPEAEAGHPVLWGMSGGQHEDHRRIGAFGDHPADCVAVESRKVTVEDNDVVAVHVELGRGFQAVVGDVDGHGLVSQALRDVICEAPYILDYEHSHRRTPFPAGPADGVACGSSMTTRRPPWGRARTASVPRCAGAIVATIESPNPTPLPGAARSAVMSRNGCPSCGSLAWSRSGPPLSTMTRAVRPSASVVTSTKPPRSLWQTALSTTLATMRASSVSLPVTSASPRCWCTARPRSAAAVRRVPSALEAIPGSETVVRSVMTPRCAPASTRKLSTRRSAWSRPLRTFPASTDASLDTGGDLPSATSSEVRIMASGVRSSWEALATKLRWASNAPSSRPRSPSTVSPSSLSSSLGPCRASRWCRLSSEIWRVVAVMTRRGRSTRPAISQPSQTETATMMIRAMPERIKSSCSSAAPWFTGYRVPACGPCTAVWPGGGYMWNGPGPGKRPDTSR